MKANYLKVIAASTMFSAGIINVNAAVDKPLSLEIKNNNADILQYWTPERLKNAKPLTPMIDENAVIPDIINNQKDVGVSGRGKGPRLKDTSQFLEQLYAPSDDHIEPNKKDPGPIIPNNAGSFGKQFSSTRIFPMFTGGNAQFSADRAYPRRTVGKLFFTEPGVGDFVCSASVLRPRVVVTAGHCVHKGSGGQAGFFTNWVFIPSFRSGVAPFGSWTPRYVTVTTTWATGNGIVPNAADYAMFEMNDKNSIKIGTVTGYLGYFTLKLNNNHADLLGYPCNLDNCQKMHDVTAQSATAVSPNNVTYGSDMRGGSSGGPWVQNFGELASGQTGGTNPGLNQIIGITSWGYESTAPKVQGSSIPDTRFAGSANSLLTIVCNHRAGNC